MDELFFKTLDAFIADVRSYREELNATTTGKDGKPKVQLIGIDGKPTDDDSILGNRQVIFEHFEKLYDAYTSQAENASIEGMHEAHSMALIAYSASYRRCVESFDDGFDEIATKLKKLDEIKNKVTSESVPAEEVSKLEGEAFNIIDEMYDIAFRMKAYYEGAQRSSVTARLMCMVMGYTEHGREFFNDPDSFEDTYTPYIDDMFQRFDKIRKMLKFNSRCASAKDMITTFR